MLEIARVGPFVFTSTAMLVERPATEEESLAALRYISAVTAVPRKQRPRKSLRRTIRATVPKHPGVYFVESGGLIKIGMSGCLAKRLTETLLIRMAAKVLLTIPTESRQQAIKLERRLHMRFGPLWVESEWFRPEAALRAFIAAGGAL